MSTPATGSDFLELVVQSGLLTRDQTEPYAGSDLADAPDAPRLLAEKMVGDGLLTTFQTRQLLAGKTRGYFFSDNKYKALLPLGTGVLGPSILCEDMRLHQQVALHLLQKAPEKDSPKAAAVEKYVREVLAVGTMNHPHLVRVFGLEWSGKTPFLVSDHVEGPTLRQLVTESGAPTIQQAAGWVRQAAAGLQHAHAKKLIHREIGPAALVLDAGGNVRVTGYGLTHLFRAAAPGGIDPNDALLAALADFMSPEQAAGLPGDARTDVYSLGATLYYLLSGRLPFEGAGVADKVTGHQSRQPTPIRELRAEVTYGLAEVLGHMMAKNPNERYQSVADVSVALAQWARDPGARAAKAPPAAPPPPPRRESTFPPLGTVASAGTSGGSWGALPPASGPPAPRPPAARPAAAPKPAPEPQLDAAFGVAGDTPRKPPSAVARPPARPAPPPEPVDLEPEPELLAPRTKSTAVTPPLTSRSRPPATGPRTGGPKTAGPKTARPAGAPAAPPPAGKKGPRLFLVLVGLLALAAVGGVVAVVVIATGGQTTPTKPQIVYVDKERDGPAPKPGPGDARNPDAGKPPAPTGDGPKPPDKTPDPAPAAGVTIHGSGSTFIGPAMEHWTELYKKKTGVNIEYSGIGSTGGVSNMIEKVLGADFGCTDAFMTPAQLEQAKGLHGEVVHVPLALGAVVAAYNLPNLKDNKLTLTGDVLALIYKGEITRWNHETIKTLNPTVAADLPDEKIVVIRRSDGSGTTAIWTEYLNDSSDGRWGKDLVGTKITWPKVDGAEDVAKSGGVAGAVAKKTGALGYVELSIALERNLKFAQIKTKGSRKAVDATLDSITAAANNASTQSDPSDFKYNLINCPGDESYPICGMTWLVLYADQSPSKKRGKELVKFLKWAVTDGQAQLKNLKYATLPEPLVKKVLAKLDTIRTSE